MAARPSIETSRRDGTERARAIDQLLLFLDNSRRPRKRPLTTGGSMEAHPRRHRYRRTDGTCPHPCTLDQILVPPVVSPLGAGVAAGLWGHGETHLLRRRVTARTVAG
jgi:hypothetical protein